MFYLAIKIVLSGLIIAIVSEVSRKFPGIGALIASLPLVSVLGMIWLWRDTGNVERMADHSTATFWYVLPSLPMFLIVPVLLRNAVPFGVTLAIGCGITIAVYLGVVWLGARLGLPL